MNWRNVWLIFRREVLDQLRDRRTLFMVAVLPLLLYPALGIGMMQLTVLFSEQPRTVVILGAADLPPPQLLDGHRFAQAWFETNTESQNKLEVITDLPAENTDTENSKPLSADAEQPSNTTKKSTASPADLARRQRILNQAKELQVLIEQLKLLNPAAVERGRPAALLSPELEATQVQLRKTMSELFKQSGIQVLIIIPPDFDQSIEAVKQQLASQRSQHGEDGAKDATSPLAPTIPLAPASNFDYPRPLIIRNRADDKSVIAYTRVVEVMESWERQILRDQLKAGGLPEQLPTPIRAHVVELADSQQVANNVWSKLFPAMLIIMAVTGAFYPAIDLAAGEKERGTMETLLICPASRTEIVLGKFFTVMGFSMATAVLNLLSLSFTGKYVSSLAASNLSRNVDLTLPAFSSLVWVAVLLIPIAALFSALCLALATFARSSKEGQYYLTPLLMVTLGLTVFCLSPAVEMQPFYSILPVVGPALLLKERLLGTADSYLLWLYSIPVLITSAGYSLLALWWAIDQFSREEVLFRESERFELKLWLKQLLRDKTPTPSFAEAGVCFVVIMLLQFAALKMFQQPLSRAKPNELGGIMLKLMIVQQVAIIATPALMMGIILTTSVRQTFQFRLPKLRYLAASIILALSVFPLSLELSHRLAWFFPPLPESMKQVGELLSKNEQPLWLLLVAFAIAPAICEELAFRGFILSGLRQGGRHGLAIVISAISFGIIHMVSQQVFNAALLGLIIGLLAVQSRSIYPGMLYHFLHNGMQVGLSQIQTQLTKPGFHQTFITVTEGELVFRPLLLLLCALIAMAALTWLVSQPYPPREESPAPAN
ncbi:ABC-2 family transporter protein [Planctopirus ephydatiae]|uniref:ABC-2 family transporter protein n=1 Tax=Planctopirus ephydatiae TaxID=2528019 RepID=A0A518GTM0_9PLAN|nr:ABC transporter permease subunit/CPBP intramembrane protease [Planctopirus ephydatiae]QDV31933.1 ABC-2 family transporter protein [Planctopirus ephydatiae]